MCAGSIFLMEAMKSIRRINTIKSVREEVKPAVAILLDTKGPEIRTGKFTDPEVNLEEGQVLLSPWTK